MDSSITAQVFSNSTFAEILDDLCVRFITYLPEEELTSVERICFQIEEAHWFYEDFIREINTSVPNLRLQEFIHQMFNHVPKSLISHIPLWKTENAFADFMTYKTRVPVRGCIMLNTTMDKCILVKGWKSGSSWSFPRGKIDQDEDDRDCAIREVYEETGFDLAGMVGAGDFIDINIRDQNIRLYIAPGVPQDYKFVPRTRKEISKIEWHDLSELPGYHGKKSQGNQNNVRQGKFFLVAPFIRELRIWISTSGKKWLAVQQKALASTQKSLASPAAKLETERDIVPCLPSIPVVDSSNGLKSLLGIENPPETVAKNHMTEAEQDEASRRLKEMLGGILQNNRADDNGNMGDALPQPQLQPQNSEMSSDKLLSILRSEASSSTPSADQLPQALPQVQQERSVPFYPLNVTQNENTPPVAMQGPTRPNTYQTSHHRLALVSTYGGTTLANSIGLSQAQRSHPLPQNNYHLPSPPLASRYGAPPSMSQSQNQFQSPHAPGPSLPKDQFDPVSLNIQPTMNAAQYPQRLGPTPYKNSSTLTETFLSSPMPTRPPDPSQAGTLLSILKGTAPSQVAEPPRDTIHVAQTPSKLAIQITPHAATIPVRNSTATLVETPTVTAPATIQSPTPPRGPRSQITQWQRQRAGVPHRSSTTAPILQIYEPPPRPITAQGQRSSVQPLLKGTPAVIDHYGAPKTPHIPNTSFDRRESVNGQRAQTLLAMFRVPSSSSESQPSGSPDEPVMPSAEAEKQMPYEAPAERPDIPVVSSTNAQNHAKTPMGKDREVLLAYLADVAKLGGVS